MTSSTSASSTTAPVDVVRSLYEALAVGDVPGVLARLHVDVVVDEPLALPYGGVHRGHQDFLENCLGAMVGHAAVTVSGYDIYDGGDGKVIGKLDGVLTAHSTGEQYPLSMVEVHEVVGDTSRRVDVFVKNPDELAAFYRRVSAG